MFFPSKAVSSNILLIIGLILLIFVVEVVCYLLPGVSLSSLIIAISGMALGFAPTLLICVIAVNAAHLLLRRDFTILVPNLMTLVPMVLFASVYGGPIVNALGWGVYGLAFGVVKWGVAIIAGTLTGRNTAKRVRDFFLEPPINYLIFAKLHFLFAFLL